VMGANFGSRWKLTRETVEAMRVLWTQREASYQGDLIKFAAVRSEPKPVQKPHPPILLGAHGDKALDRVARTYDGWMPIVDGPDQLKRDVTALRKLAQERGRNPDQIAIAPFVDPGENGLSLDDLKRYRDAGAQRVILFSQAVAAQTAAGKALDFIKQFAPTVERAAQVK
jgi:alkanesulfonate monooxygenase SsuD/methylene tetrahydromethanopterin reductase-like flavin-dependent oxidoreductase (luciferase family)